MRLLSLSLSLSLALGMSLNLAHAHDESSKKESFDLFYAAACKNEYPADMSGKPLDQLKEGGEQIRTLLRDPKTTLRAILRDRVGESTTSVFGVLITCIIVTSVQNRLEQEGCKDVNGTVIDSKEALQLCAKALALARKEPR
jgi:hypothetical protein